MSYKCVLTPHHRIPKPILSILVGRLPQVSTTIEDVTDDAVAASDMSPSFHKHGKDDKDDRGDSWDKDWNWGDEEEVAKSSKPVDFYSPPMSGSSGSDERIDGASLPPLTESYIASASADGRFLVMAHETKFVVVELSEDEGEYLAKGQGSGCEAEGETITAILCLPLFVPSIRKNQIFVMAGYSTGWLRMFTETGTMVTAQLLEPAAVVSIRLRTPPQVFKAPRHMIPDEDEEITIVFQNRRIVSIDGQSLWMVLRVCDGQRESGIDASRSQTAFTYKKYELQYQEQVNDAISLGPSPQRSHTTTFLEQSSTISTAPFPEAATSRYVSVGSSPMLCYYATTETSRPLMSAVHMASYVMARVATPVLSFAKSWWQGSGASPSNSSPRSNSPSPYVPDMHAPPTHIEPATAIPAVLSLSDASRRITQISVCPPSTSAQRHPLAATSDMLGRVILWDLASGEMVRMWKGVRDAVCGWVEFKEDDVVKLFLVIYSERRGLLLVFHMRHGKQVGMFRVGSGWRLVPCGREPLGSSMVSIERRRMAMHQDEGECGCLSKCLLIGPDGEVRNIVIMRRPAKPSV